MTDRYPEYSAEMDSEEPDGYQGPGGSRNDPVMEVTGICHMCVHQYRDPWKCKAFPNGIPSEILIGNRLHTEPYWGDNGIQFEKKGGTFT